MSFWLRAGTFESTEFQVWSWVCCQVRSGVELREVMEVELEKLGTKMARWKDTPARIICRLADS